MKCRACGSENAEGKNFCADCGAALPLRCTACGAENLPGKKFCGDCGASLAVTVGPTPRESAAAIPPSSAVAAPEAERRQLTVMFCDLVGSTALSERLDPEDLREVICAYQETCAGVVARFDGFIAKYMGDGILVYFGYPQAHEDDAARAVRAGLAILDAMGTLNSRLQSERALSLAVRMGIHTGLVVAGEMGGGEVREERAIVGETPNVAARLEGLAVSNSIVIGPLTYQLVGDQFECDDLGPQIVKGISQPIPVYHVRAERLAESRFEAVHVAGLTPLVGRGQEIALLLDRWEQAKHGEGQVVLLSGEAGIGKSRITETLGERLAEEPHTRLRYQCSPYHTNSALYPAISQLEHAARFAPDDPSARKLDKLEGLLAQPTRAVKEVAPLIAALLSIPAGERYPPLDMTPQRQKQKTFEALVDQLVGHAAQQPVLLIVEDAHWSDPSTQELLELTVDQARDSRVLMVITFRPEFTPPWRGHTHVTLLTLDRLGHRQCAAMVEKVTAGKALPMEVLDQIVAKTDGVPLFVEELTKTVLESALVEDAGDRYALTGPLPPLAIPSTLQDSLMARLDRLGPAKEVAQTGAAFGRNFPYGLLAAVSPLRDSELEDALGQLVQSELIFQRGTPPQATYTFKHALVQDAAYGNLLRKRRQQLHCRIANVLEAQFPERVQAEPELLAHHYTEARLADQAVGYWLRAGQRTSERSANLEAIAHCAKGLELINSLPETAARARQELGLHLTLGPALISIRGMAAPEVEQAYLRARELCRQVGEPSQLFTVTWGLWLHYVQCAQLKTAQGLADEVLAVAERQSDPALLLQAHHAAWTTLSVCGELPSYRDHAEQGIALYNIDEHRSHAVLYGGHDPGVCCRVHAAMSLWFLGYADQALEKAHDSMTLADELSHPFSLAIAHGFSTFVHQYRREAGLTLERAEAIIALCAEQGFAQWRAVGNILRGWAVAAEGQAAAGVAEINQGVIDYRATGAKLRVPHYLTLLAEAYGQAGQADQGLNALTEALNLVEKTGERRWEAEIYRLKGELLLSRSAKNSAEAEACFNQAIEVARRQSAKSLELRTAASLARLWQGQGKIAEARDLLAPVYDWFTEGFDTIDLQEAKALLNEIT